MRRALEGRGAVVVAEGAFGPGTRNITRNAASFAGQLLAAAWHGQNYQPSGSEHRPEPRPAER